MRTELSIDIDRPIDEVFPLTTEHVTEWSITCVEDEVIEEKPGGVGTTFRLVTEERGRKMEFHGTVTEHDAPRRSRVALVGSAFDLDVLYTFEDLGGRTRVTQASEIRGKGLFRIMLALMGWMMKRAGCKAQESELESLKRFCETRKDG